MRIAVAELTLNNNADALRNFWVRIPDIFLGPAIKAKHTIVVAAQSGKNANIPIQSLATFANISACLCEGHVPILIYEDARVRIGCLEVK